MSFNPIPKPEKRDKKKKKSISPVSVTKGLENEYYSVIAKWFKSQNRKCAVCNVRPTEDVHHKMGRQGYSDKWAETLDIPLLLDIRHWLNVCRTCHTEIELNPEWAKENNYSLNRIK